MELLDELIKKELEDIVGLDIEKAWKVKEIVDEIVREWDYRVRLAIDFYEVEEEPVKICECGCPAILPIDYFTEEDGMVVLSSICRSCKGYKEVPMVGFKFPVSYKKPPKIHGLLVNSDLFKPEENHNSMVI